MTIIKRCAIGILSLSFLLVPAFVLTANEGGHGSGIDQIIAEIEQTQGVDTISEINPDRVSPKLLEELGDAVMGIMISDEQQHEWMDQMMGGEGSEQLASMHRLMGYRYLQSNGDLSSGLWGPGMSGYGMMGPGMMGSWGVSSGWYGPGSPDVMAGLMTPWLCAICLVLLIAVIVLIIALVKAKRHV